MFVIVEHCKPNQIARLNPKDSAQLQYFQYWYQKQDKLNLMDQQQMQT